MKDQSKLSGWYSWPAIICMLIVFWPVGLYLMIKRLSSGEKPAKRTGRGAKIAGWIILAYSASVIVMLISDGFTTDSVAVLLILISLGVFLCRLGKKMEKETDDTKRYLSLILDGNVRKLDEISAAVGKSAEAVKADLMKLIRNGSLPNAYINEGTREVVLPRRTNSFADKNLYADPVAAKRPPKVVTCECCGGKNTVTGTGGECEYCGSPLK